MLKDSDSFKLRNPAENDGDKINLGGGINAVLKISMSFDNPVYDTRVFYADLNIVDANGNIFYTQPCEPVLRKLTDSTTLEDEKFEESLKDRNIKNQTIAIKAVLRKLPQIIRDKMEENLKQNELFESALS